MRRRLAAGNWKMNGTAAGLSEVEALLQAHLSPRVEILLCPPATLLAQMNWKKGQHPLQLGGQDCHAAASGAHAQPEVTVDGQVVHAAADAAEHSTSTWEQDAPGQG